MLRMLQKTNILPNQSRIFIAGKAADISEGLEKLGYPVNYYDKDANKIEKPATKKSRCQCICSQHC